MGNDGRAAKDGPVECRARVLVVDDEELVLRVFQRVLKEHDVVVELNARAALARLNRSERFDVIFCDVSVLVTGGRDVFEALCALDPAIAGRVVGVSGDPDSPGAQELTTRLGSAVLLKPFEHHVLRAIVAECVARRTRPAPVATVAEHTST